MVLAIVLYFSSSFLSICQEEYPVTWHITAHSAGNNSYEIQFEAFIDKGWVIYGMESSVDGPVATTFSFDATTDIRMEGKTTEITKAEANFEPLFGLEVLKFSKKAIFAQKVIRLGNSMVIKGNINYMACDGSKCLPPTDVPFVTLLK
ncbi:MAG: hypothetical protein V3V00_13645 [Saprospiraceae bacterium]